MSVLTEIVEGWTGRLPFTLLRNGAALDGTGLTLTDCLITGKDGTTVSTAGDFGWIAQASGTVYLDPDALDFLAAKSPYTVRFQVTDGDGKIVYFPKNATDTITVHRVRG
jgi:hypothetical protein